MSAVAPEPSHEITVITVTPVVAVDESLECTVYGFSFIFALSVSQFSVTTHGGPAAMLIIAFLSVGTELGPARMYSFR